LTTDLPWYGTIIGTVVVMRTMLFPLSLAAQRSAARTALLRPELERMTAKIKAAATDTERQRYQAELGQTMTVNGANPLKGMAYGLAQAPFLISLFLALRGLGERFPEINQGGALWFTDLSVPDPYYILPAISSLTMLLSMEINFAVENAPTKQTTIIKYFFRGMCVVFFPLTCFMPTAIFMYWIPSNLWMVAQNSILKTKRGKEFFGIPIVPTGLKDALEGESMKAKDDLKAVKPVSVYTRRK
jgi:YidC/Oxa1 family membrane protein insertase